MKPKKTTINPSVFKSYDIRGIYPDDLNEETASLIGQAFVQYTKAKKVVIGRDMRLSSPVLTKKIIEGVISQGASVDDIGLVSIDAVYYATGKHGYDGGIMITASHNPKEYGGCKMVIKTDNGIDWIRGKQLYDFLKNKKFEKAATPGTVSECDIIPEFIAHILSFADLDKIKPFRVVIDAGNGMAGKMIPFIFDKLPCEYIPLNFKLDGNFPAHPSNPLLPESRVQIREAVLKEKADFGVIFDGDTDRLFFIDEKGSFIRADTTLLILAKYFLEHNPNAGIAYNVICSKAVPERVTAWGGRPIRTAVGFVNLAKGMKKQDGIMSGELSAHYAFRDNYYADSGFIALVILLMLISEHNQQLSETAQGLVPYAKGDEVNLEVNNIPEVIKKVKEQYKDGEQDELDGVTIQYDTWWLNVRPSNTEPLLRITIEADTKKILKEKQTEVVDFIKSVFA